ncbi:MAG: hypothetical protein IAA97_06045 [Spirochaetes bacterium]|uniref:Uncharacterized protein n=1 Tax=Candidatus Ornithospirochaeta stercoripullorum TaxID=2840899 RepID=A0A9D9H632_9SPIO|nr:hypothetical protein [Candidatus Ornithospirochaeta stercoripullorum]
MYTTSTSDRLIAMFLIAAILISSCSLPQSGPGTISSTALVSASGRAIDLYLDDIRGFVEEDLEVRGILDDVDGYEVATRTIEEEQGRDYLEFTLETSQFESVDDVLAAAEGLVPEEELEAIEAQVDEAEKRLFKAVEEQTRILTPEQQEDFYNDLTVLVIKSSVLLTSAVVYALVPDTVLWGKVTAASAIAIASGVLAATIMAIVEHYRNDMDLDETFIEWLDDVAKEPAVYWGLASSVIAISQSMQRGPIVTSIILAIFTIFGVTEDAKAMLEKYNFSA